MILYSPSLKKTADFGRNKVKTAHVEKELMVNNKTGHRLGRAVIYDIKPLAPAKQKFFWGEWLKRKFYERMKTFFESEEKYYKETQ